MRDIVARSMTKFFRLIADTFFAKRYGHRAVVLRDGRWCARHGCRYVVALRKSAKDEDGLRCRYQGAAR